ncbi:MAG: ABC transporter ATP-binding protein [Phycisphaerales bacterium]|nr:ABC transporter ATP-binding protein [Phycisphaerales bacterium]
MNEAGAQKELAICARGLVKKYEQGRIVALDGLDLDVAQGEFVAIYGPSGCGKSTLLNLITAIDRPDRGNLTVCGRSLGTMTEPDADEFRASIVGLVFQLHNLLPNLTAIENVQLPMLGNGTNGPERVRRAKHLLDSVGLGDRTGALPTTLSGGQRQRVAIARALANQPSVLLADEPTGSLDSKTGDKLIDLLCELQQEFDMTIIVVTHNTEIADSAQRVVHMLDGKIVQNHEENVSEPALFQTEDIS